MMAPATSQRPRRRCRATAPTQPGVSHGGLVPTLQRGWWVLGIVGTLVGALGFQTLPPARRLVALETARARHDVVDARQDSVLAAFVREQQRAFEGINRQLGQLIAGQCAKERDRMARLVYGCPGAGQ